MESFGYIFEYNGAKGQLHLTPVYNDYYKRLGQIHARIWTQVTLHIRFGFVHANFLANFHLIFSFYI